MSRKRWPPDFNHSAVSVGATTFTPENPAAGFGQGQRNPPAEAGVATGDDGDLARQVEWIAHLSDPFSTRSFRAPSTSGGWSIRGKSIKAFMKPIVDLETWEGVDCLLAEHAQRRAGARHDFDALLAGKLFDDRGNRMEVYRLEHKLGGLHRRSSAPSAGRLRPHLVDLVRSGIRGHGAARMGGSVSKGGMFLPAGLPSRRFFRMWHRWFAPWERSGDQHDAGGLRPCRRTGRVPEAHPVTRPRRPRALDTHEWTFRHLTRSSVAHCGCKTVVL